MLKQMWVRFGFKASLKQDFEFDQVLVGLIEINVKGSK